MFTKWQADTNGVNSKRRKLAVSVKYSKFKLSNGIQI